MTPSKAEDWDGTQTCLMRLESDDHIAIINIIIIIIIVPVISDVPYVTIILSILFKGIFQNFYSYSLISKFIFCFLHFEYLHISQIFDK